MKNFKEMRESTILENNKTELSEANVSRSDFEKLKKGMKIEIAFGSSISSKQKAVFTVKSTSRSAKYNVDKVNMTIDGRGKYHLYSRGGKDATLALGNMAAIINSYKILGTNESVELDEAVFSSAQVKAAIKIAKDMPKDKEGAIKKINQIRRGLSDDSMVAVALRSAGKSMDLNRRLMQKESVELNEAPDLMKMSKELLKHKDKGIDYEKAAAYVRTMHNNSSLMVQDKAMKGLLSLLKNMDLTDRTTITKILKDNGFKVKGGQLMRESLDESGMTSAQKKKFDTLYKKMDGGKEHKAIRQKILNPVKADDAFHALVKKMAMESVELDESVDCLEEAMLNEFSDAQLNQLKKAYSDLEKINVTSPTYKKLKKMLADMDVKPLEKVARKKIKFVSQIAARELLAKGGPKLKAGEYMEF